MENKPEFIDVTNPDELIPENLRIQKVITRFPYEDEYTTILNKPGTKAANIIARNMRDDGYIYVEKKEASKILENFTKECGEQVIKDARDNLGKHTTIDRLLQIIDGKESELKVIIENHPTPKILGSYKSKVLYDVVKQFGTPVQVYFEDGIINSAKELQNAFEWTNFKNYFAVKATPNPFIIKLLFNQGMGTDCSSDIELQLSKILGINGKDIMFTSNDTPDSEFKLAREMGAIINLDDITHIPVLENAAGIPDTICFRYNPGKLKRGNSIIGNPCDAKYGLKLDQLILAYKIMKEKGVLHFGLHTMVASNERDPEYFVDTARLLFETVKKIKDETGVDIEFVNLGGGIGIPYRSDQKKVDLKIISNGVQQKFNEIIIGNELYPCNILMECGRMVTGPHGYLVTTVRHVTEKFNTYVGVDACMANLMRHGLYGSYHEITPLGKEHITHDHLYDITGSLCENNDRLATARLLPKLERGDILAIHDTGAHGHAMGFNYNGKKRAREVLIRTDGSFYEIRRPEEFKDITATIPLEKIKDLKV